MIFDILNNVNDNIKQNMFHYDEYGNRFDIDKAIEFEQNIKELIEIE